MKKRYLALTAAVFAAALCAPALPAFYAAASDTPNAVSSASKTKGIDEKKAKKIALKQVPGAALSDIVKFDFDKSKQYYIVQIYYMTKSYEITVSAADGSVLYFDKQT